VQPAPVAPGPAQPPAQSPVTEPPKRTGRILGGAAAALILLLGGLYLATRHTPGPGPAPGPRPTAQQAAAVCASGSLQLYGSSAFQEIAQNAATAYQNACPNAKTRITVNQGVSRIDSAIGVSRLAGEVASGSPAAKSTIAMYDGSGTTLATRLPRHPAGILIYSVIANRALVNGGLFPGAKTTSGQLAGIFARHAAPRVVAVSRPGGSGTRLAFTGKVLAGARPPAAGVGGCPQPTGKPFPLPACTVNDTAAELAFVNGTPNAVGYAEVFGGLQGEPQVTALSLNGTEPKAASVLNGSYPFWTPETFYSAPVMSPLARDFLAYLPTYVEQNPPGDFLTCAQAQAARLARSGCGGA
jgi:ABC-type phosphate transport system substrate-binding protein